MPFVVAARAVCLLATGNRALAAQIGAHVPPEVARYLIRKATNHDLYRDAEQLLGWLIAEGRVKFQWRMTPSGPLAPGNRAELSYLRIEGSHAVRIDNGAPTRWDVVVDEFSVLRESRSVPANELAEQRWTAIQGLKALFEKRISFAELAADVAASGGQDDDPAAAGGDAPAQGTIARRHDQITGALRELQAAGKLHLGMPVGQVRRLVIRHLGYREATVPRGFSDDTIARLWRQM